MIGLNLAVVSYCGASPDADCLLSSSSSSVAAAAGRRPRQRHACLPACLPLGRQTHGRGRTDGKTDADVRTEQPSRYRRPFAPRQSVGKRNARERERERERGREGEREREACLYVCLSWRPRPVGDAMFSALESAPAVLKTESKGRGREGGRKAGRQEWRLDFGKGPFSRSHCHKIDIPGGRRSPTGRTQRPNGMEWNGKKHGG